MNLEQSRTRALRAIDLLLTAILIVMVAASSLSTAAYALDTVKCTARPNGDTGSDVLGGIELELVEKKRDFASELRFKQRRAAKRRSLESGGVRLQVSEHKENDAVARL